MESIEKFDKQNLKDSKTQSKSATKINLNLEQLTKDVHLNESTDGFVTQINLADNESIKTATNTNTNSEISKLYIQNMNPSLMIPTESEDNNNNNNKKPKKKSNFNDSSENFQSTVRTTRLDKDYDFVIPSLKSQTNSFVSAQPIIINTNTNTNTASNKNDLKEDTKSTFDYFPDIPAVKSKTPNRKNFFNRSIYIKYLTNKIEREAKTKNVLSTKSGKLARLKKNNQNNFNATLTTNEIKDDKQDEDTTKKEVSRPSSPIEAKENNSNNIIKSYYKPKRDLNNNNTNNNNNNNNNNIKNKNLKNEIIQLRNELRRREKAKSGGALRFQEQIEQARRAKSRHTEDIKLLSRHNNNRKIIDLNIIGGQSKLSSHYLSQSGRKLSDLKLSDNWPSSNMYKFSIQSNPWVKSFKERSYANELNSNFRELKDLPNLTVKKNLNYLLMPSRIETKTSPNFFPSIKQMV